MNLFHYINKGFLYLRLDGLHRLHKIPVSISTNLQGSIKINLSSTIYLLKLFQGLVMAIPLVYNIGLKPLNLNWFLYRYMKVRTSMRKENQIHTPVKALVGGELLFSFSAATLTWSLAAADAE